MLEKTYYNAMGAFQYFFRGCSALKKIVTHFTTYDSTFLTKWVENVSSTGDFYNLGGATFEKGTDGIPTNWTEHRTLAWKTEKYYSYITKNDNDKIIIFHLNKDKKLF